MAQVQSVLPPELTDKICFLLRDDRRSLSVCGQLHRSWVASARVHLFNTVTIDASKGLDILSAVFLGPNASAIFQSIRHLTIRDNTVRSWHSRWTGAGKSPIDQILSASTVPQMFLSELNIIGLQYAALSPVAQENLKRIASSATTMRLRGVRFGSVHSLMEYIASAESLEKLRAFDCLHKQPKNAETLLKCPPLRIISAPAYLLRIIVNWNATSFGGASTIKSVDLLGEGDKKLSKLEHWQELQGCLERIEHGGRNSSALMNPGFDSKACSSLRSIVLHAGYVYNSNTVTQHLTSIESGELEHLDLSLWSSSTDSFLRGLFLQEISDYLDAHPKVKLRIVVGAQKHGSATYREKYRLPNGYEADIAFVDPSGDLWNDSRPCFEEIFDAKKIGRIH